MTTLCLDNSFVSDLLDERSYAGEFLCEFDDPAIIVPSIVRYEALVPAFQSGEGRTARRTETALAAFEQVGFDAAEARESAEIRAALIESGQQIGAPDVLIAGVARANDAALVTVDSHFERVPELEVYNLDDRR